MGWETRKGKGRYYTRSVRVGGRVVREYVGSGPAADIAAALDEANREERRAECETRRLEQAKLEAAAAALSALGSAADAEMKRRLGEAGYHYRKGEWRKKHDHDR